MHGSSVSAEMRSVAVSRSLVGWPSLHEEGIAHEVPFKIKKMVMASIAGMTKISGHGPMRIVGPLDSRSLVRRVRSLFRMEAVEVPIWSIEKRMVDTTNGFGSD